MSTRRMYLQPGESCEVCNLYGTSLIKIVAAFDKLEPVAVLYPQPGVRTYGPSEAEQFTPEAEQFAQEQ
jgi:hypothetical protein